MLGHYKQDKEQILSYMQNMEEPEVHVYNV